MSVISFIKAKESFVSMSGVSKEQILTAEKALGLKFSEDYIAYVSEYGVVSFAGHELTGICSSPRLNVVDATKRIREIYSHVDLSWYVLEDANVDEIVIWQDKRGNVYRTDLNNVVKKVADSLAEYIGEDTKES